MLKMIKLYKYLDTPQSVRFFQDPNYAKGCFSKQNIPPTALGNYDIFEFD